MINIYLIFLDNQLFLIAKVSIPIGTRIYSNKIILPKLNMNKNISIKQEPIENENKKSYRKIFYLIKTFYFIDFFFFLASIFICEECGIRFINRNTLNAHRQYYCIKQETTTINSTGVKRKSTDNSFLIPLAKRLSNDRYCDNLYSKTDNFLQDESLSSCKLNNTKTISFNHPIQIGQFIYVPIPIKSSEIINKSLDLSRQENEDKLYQCKYCSIHFRSLKTLNAHQDNYCIAHKDSYLSLFKCTICSAMFNNKDTLLSHIKYVHTSEKLIECLECRSKFCSKWNLIRHMKLLHTNMKDDEEESNDFMNLNRQFINKKQFLCRFCFIKFSNIDTLKEHMTNYCSLRTTNDDNNDIKDITFYCSLCQISFQHRLSYEAHKKYYCPDGKKRNVKIST